METDETKVLESIKLELNIDGFPDREHLRLYISAVTVETTEAPPRISGGGTIPTEDETGKCTFGFGAQRNEGQAFPTGHFYYHDLVAGLQLNSYSLQELNHSRFALGAVFFEGWGTVNGVDGYNFRVRFTDDSDELRIRIIGPGVDYLNIQTISHADNSTGFRVISKLESAQNIFCF